MGVESAYSPATTVSVALTAVMCVVQIGVLVFAVRLLRERRGGTTGGDREHHKSPHATHPTATTHETAGGTGGTGGTTTIHTGHTSHANLGAHGQLLGFSIPALLRWSFLFSSIFALLLGLISVTSQWTRVSVHTAFAPHDWRTTDWGGLTAEDVWCVTASKGGCGSYVVAKFFSYIFFFAKQRTVRPMSQGFSFMEKQALLGTACVVGFLVVLVVMAQGDSSVLDNTCQPFIPFGLIIFNLVADTGLSTIYLYLFIQPLRATIAANRRVQASHLAGAGAALETVMRRNMLSCLVSVISCTISMIWMFVAHAVEQPFMRKWISFMGTLDACITILCVAHSFYKSSSSSSSSSASASPNAVVPLHTIHDHASANNGTPKPPLHAGGPTSKASSREVTTTSHPQMLQVPNQPQASGSHNQPQPPKSHLDEASTVSSPTSPQPAPSRQPSPGFPSSHPHPSPSSPVVAANPPRGERLFSPHSRTSSYVVLNHIDPLAPTAAPTATNSPGLSPHARRMMTSRVPSLHTSSFDGASSVFSFLPPASSPVASSSSSAPYPLAAVDESRAAPEPPPTLAIAVPTAAASSIAAVATPGTPQRSPASQPHRRALLRVTPIY